MKKILLYSLLLISIHHLSAQDVFWLEDFDNGATTRWDVSGNHPTPAGIPGLVYGTNNNFDFFVINDANTPELSGPLTVGLPINQQGQFVQGRHYDCAAPNDLPNPFVNSGAVNRSLHITAQAGCSGLIYAGTPGYDDWNCLTISGNDATLTQTEQYAAYNTNIDATGKCNIVLTADFFLGGSANGLEAHSTILYSIDGGVTWAIVQDNLASCLHTFAGTCNDWYRRSFQLPADADNQPDLRVAFRWVEDGNTNNNTQDYALGASFNVDNVMLSACNKPAIDIFTQNTTACKNQTITLNPQVTTATTLYSNCFSLLSNTCPTSGYSWTITGPGTVTFVNGTSATDENPQIQLSANGSYTVELTATNCAGDSTLTKTNYITVSNCPPSANFSASTFSACTSPTTKLDTVSFTDLSSTPSVPITSWSWSFSPGTVTFVNGTTASDPNPQVTFDAAGSYEVTLQVTSADGSDTEVKTAYIEAISCECGGGAGGPTNLYFTDFLSGAGGFTLNSVEAALGTTAGNENYWGINAAYTGTFFPATPNRGGNSYLHIISNTACGGFFGECQSVFNATSSGARSFAKTPVINASGATGVSISFWTLNASTGASGRGYLYYSIDGGATWIQEATFNSISAWTFQTFANPAFDNQANLRFGFLFDEGVTTTGVLDPAFAIDEVSVDAAGAATLPTTWEGSTSTNWATASNWSTNAVPTATDDVLVPNSTDLVGTFMPTISAAAVARNVCNFGTITLTGNNTLTIDEELLNDGVVTTDNVNPADDVIFANAASTYRGSGTMYDVDVAVTSSDLTLLNNLTTRSLNSSTTGTVDLGTFTLAINKNLTKSAGTLIATNGEIHFIDACGSCVDATSDATVTLNANQDFGNVLVNKTDGVVTALVSNVNHTFTSPKTLTIQSGILDANANTVIGTGNLTMTGGEFQLAKNATALPELTGNYLLTGGQVTLDGGNQIIKSQADISAKYYDLEFTGTGIKTFSSTDVVVENQLFLTLPTTLGNYVDTDVDILQVDNSSPTAVVHTGGHVVGFLGRAVTPSNAYQFDVGSDNAGGDTYYEPMLVTTNSLGGATNLVGHFDDNSPNPTTVNNVTFQVNGAIDTVKQVETEGFWTILPDNPAAGGNYEVRVNPSSFWTFTQPWAAGYYCLLKQDASAQPWDFNNGGIRVNDSTTTTFADFSNYALAFADTIIPTLAIELAWFRGEQVPAGHELSWATAEEVDHSHFVLQRSANGLEFEQLSRIEGVGNSVSLQTYSELDRQPLRGWNYYRLKSVDNYGGFEYSQVIALYHEQDEIGLSIYPNPANNQVTFDYRGADPNARFVVRIYDASGREVLAREYENAAGRIFQQIDTRNFAAGMYFVQFSNGDTTRSVKLLIED